MCDFFLNIRLCRFMRSKLYLFLLFSSFLFLGTGCSSFSKGTTVNELKIGEGEEYVSVKAAVELARSAYSAGCVRTYNERQKKGHYAECLNAANQFIDEDIMPIMRSQPFTPAKEK